MTVTVIGVPTPGGHGQQFLSPVNATPIAAPSAPNDEATPTDLRIAIRLASGDIDLRLGGSGRNAGPIKLPKAPPRMPAIQGTALMEVMLPLNCQVG